MSGPIATLDPTTPKIPDELWRQSGIPATGWLVRGWIALVLITAGWILAEVTGSVYLWALAAVGIALFFLLPSLVESLVLARLNAKIDAVELERNADKGHAVLEQLRKNTTAKLLAPHGWLRVQEGRVHLAVGDGRAAAKAFAEAERVSTHADKHELISAQAHALVLAGDRKEARELLAKLRKSDQLSELDHLNYGVVLLSEAGHNQEALGHLQQAREAFGDHPRALAGLVLALQRCDKTSEATALLREAEAAVEDSADQLALDLLKRAKKGLRPLLKAQQKRERKVEKKPEASEAASADAGRKPKGKKGRKQSRRDARKKAKADARRDDGEQVEAGEEQLEAGERDEVEAVQTTVDETASRAPVVEPAVAEDDRINRIEREDEPAVAAEPPSAPVEIAASEPTPAHEPEQAAEPPSREPAIESPLVAAEPEPARAKLEPAVEPEPAPAKPELAVEPEPEPTPLPRITLEPVTPAASTSSSTRAKPKPKDDDDDDIDLATLALEALGSGSRRKLDESEGGPSASGLRPIEPSASSGSLFRSALFDEPKPSASASGSSPSLFSLPKLDSVPTFAPPPKPTRGPVLPSRPTEPSAKPVPAPSKPESPKPAVPSVPSVTPPKLGAAPSAPSIPTAKPVPSVPSISAPKPATPALDDGWGDLGELDPFAAPPTSPPVKDEP